MRSSTSPNGKLNLWMQSLTRSASADSHGVIEIASRQVYILPTRYGFMYAMMLLAMLLGSNNYGSNPGFLLTFLLAGLGMAALFQTWKNLVGLRLTPRAGDAVFCGDIASYRLQLHNTSLAPRGAITASIKVPKKRRRFFKRGNREEVLLTQLQAVDIDAAGETELIVVRRAERRGLQPAGRIVISSSFPLGLFRAWSYIESDVRCLVYPEPATEADGCDRDAGDGQQTRYQPIDNDDFVGHKPYQQGDNIMHVDWKVAARGKGLHLKDFSVVKGKQVWLRWQATRSEDPEQRLAQLTRAVLDCDDNETLYGLDLGTTQIAPDSGSRHRNACLEALALFNA